MTVTTRAATDSRFRAFVSYSHADKVAARRLHDRLESYRLPQHLRADAHHCTADGRLGAIFRDREDLPAAEDLTQSVKQALAASDALIVLCSPDARKSPWVAREIDLFRDLHPDRPVLAAVLRGDPEDAFPEPLTHGREPLAADLRKEGDGARLGFLKVVAGVAGVPLDALVQRDAQRRLRRVTAVTVAAFAAVLVMALMTMFALQSRNEARHQRAEAEGLIEYMLTDLRTDLRGVGRLDVMQGVNIRAMGYYASQEDLSDFPADSLERRARVLHSLGEDEGRLGRFDAALSNFREAHRVTAELLEREPANADRIFAHAQSEYWIGFAAWGRDPEIVKRAWQGYLDQAKRLSAREPDSIRSLMEMGYAHGNLCELSMDQGRADTALSHCRRSIMFERQAVAAEPGNSGNVMALANRHGWLADALMRSGSFEDALAERRKEADLIEGLRRADDSNAQIGLRATAPLIGMGEIALRRGEPEQGIEPLDEAIGRLGRLAAGDPGDGHIGLMQVRSLLFRADARKRLGKAGWEEDFQTAKRTTARFKSGADDPLRDRMTTLIRKFEMGDQS